MVHLVDHESDSRLLPEGMERMGYDADTQIYSYVDKTTGKHYHGEEGNRYGKLYPVGEPRMLPTPSAQEAQNLQIQSSNLEALRHMLPFGVAVIAFMLLIFYYVGFTS